MKNITQLRAALVETFNSVKSGKLDVQSAKEMNKAAGQILKSCSIELQYQSYTTDKPSIPFLDNK